MTLSQKTGRIFLLSVTLLVASVLFAMAGAVGLFIMERGREMGRYTSVLPWPRDHRLRPCGQFSLRFLLFQVKKADTKLVPPKK